MNSVGAVLDEISSQVTSRREAQWILAHALGLSSTVLMAHLDDPMTREEALAVAEMVGRRCAGEPLQYVIGTWDFRALEVGVGPQVLIPRPETEQVVGYALGELANLFADPGHAVPVVAVDLGTGSGVIALSLAAESSPAADRSLEVWAVDSSPAALELAQENLSLLAGRDPVAGTRVRFVLGDWFEALPDDLAERVDLIVSNPPYISVSDWLALAPEVRDHEPREALVAGETGRECLDKLVAGAPRWLAPGGSLVLELSPEQAGVMQETAAAAGFADVRVLPDLAGLPRALVARLAHRDGSPRPGLHR